MRTTSKIAMLVAITLFPVTLCADVERCPIVSSGAQTTLPGSFHNAGQSVIDVSSSAAVVAHHGGLACLRVHSACLLGDVNGDGLVDGDDIQRYTEVTFTGIGSPRELCAANLSVGAFVTLLLS